MFAKELTKLSGNHFAIYPTFVLRGQQLGIPINYDKKSWCTSCKGEHCPL